MVSGRGFDSPRLHQLQNEARPGNDPGRAFVFSDVSSPPLGRIRATWRFVDVYSDGT